MTKKYKKWSVPFLSILIVMCLVVPSYAKTQELIKEYEFESTDKNFNYPAEQTIVEKGKTYKLKDVQYEIIADLGKDTIKKDIQDLKEKKAPKIENIDGVGYILDESKTTYEPMRKTGTYVYTARSPEGFTPDQEREVEDQNGKTFVGKLENVTKGATYPNEISIDGVYTGDTNSQYFYFAKSDTLYPINTAAPLWNGYQQDILNYLSLDPEAYEITGGSWISESIEGKKITKVARYSGYSQVCDYTCTYSAGDSDKYTAKAVYQSPYKVKAVATYQEDNSLTMTQKLIMAGAGILVLAILIASILFFLKKKRENEAQA